MISSSRSARTPNWPHGPAAADRHSLAGPCLIADGVTYLEVHDLARLLGMFYGG